MRAVVLRGKGGPEVIAVEELPDPVPGAEEVLVDITASALNRADLLQRQGYYPPPPGAPDIPGLEFSGVVAEVGERCRLRVTLATGIPEDVVRRANLGYLDPAAVDLEAFRADGETFVVPEAGEVLFRLR